MISGTVPNFIDVVLNLGSSELKTDSIIHQLIQKNERISFCGDNTWVKMFPNKFHRQLENMDSLFVNDFYEVIIEFFLTTCHAYKNDYYQRVTKT